MPTSARPLPAGDLAARYAGIVTWFTDDDLPGPDRFEKWLSRQLDDGLKVAIFDHLGFAPSATLLARLGLVAPPRSRAGAVASCQATTGSDSKRRRRRARGSGRRGTRPG